jgi:probable addiction module antidote protein
VPPSKPYHPELIKALRDPREALGYLNATLEDGDPEVFLMGLRDVAEAQGGIAAVAEAAKLNRENLYRMLSDRGNPELRSLDALLHALGFRLSIAVEDRR